MKTPQKNQITTRMTLLFFPRSLRRHVMLNRWKKRDLWLLFILLLIYCVILMLAVKSAKGLRRRMKHVHPLYGPVWIRYRVSTNQPKTPRDNTSLPLPLQLPFFLPPGTECPSVPKKIIDCHPDGTPTINSCIERRCCWFLKRSKSDMTSARCIIPERYFTYDIDTYSNTTDGHFISLKPKIDLNLEMNDNVTVSITSISFSVTRMMIIPESKKVFRPSVPVITDTIMDDAMDIRHNAGGTLQIGPTVFYLNQLLYLGNTMQCVMCLPENTTIYGFDQTRASLIISPLWREYFPYNPSHGSFINSNLHSFFLFILHNGSAGGLFLLNSGPMKLVTQPGPCLTFTTLSGIHEYFVFSASSPARVVRHYWDLVGAPMMPNWRSLRFSDIRKSYKLISRLHDQSRIARAFNYIALNWEELPQHSQEAQIRTDAGGTFFCVSDLGIVHSMTDFTDFASDRLSSGLIADICSKDTECGIHLFDVEMPRCLNSETCAKVPGINTFLHEAIDVEQYMCLTNQVGNSTFLESYHSYFYQQAKSYHLALLANLRRRPNFVSRVSFAGQGKYSGHWNHDGPTTLDDIRRSIAHMLAYNIYGIPLVGSNVCAHSMEFCALSIAASVWFPLAKRHFDFGFYDAAIPEINAAIDINEKIRNTLLHYLYTLFYRAHLYNEMVVRPLLFEFPDDRQTYTIFSQFMWGSGLLISPVIDAFNQTTQRLYIPSGLWYDWFTYKPTVSTGKYYQHEKISSNNLSAVFCRGGSIIPIDNVPDSFRTVRHVLGLVICLDDSMSASGEMFRDHGDRNEVFRTGEYSVYSFKFDKYTLTCRCSPCSTEFQDELKLVRILGLGNKHVTVKSRDRILDAKTEPYSTLVSNFSFSLGNTMRFYINIKPQVE